MSDFSCPICSKTYETNDIVVGLPCHKCHMCSTCAQDRINTAARNLWDRTPKCDVCGQGFCKEDLRFYKYNSVNGRCFDLNSQQHAEVASDFNSNIGLLVGIGNAISSWINAPRAVPETIDVNRDSAVVPAPASLATAALTTDGATTAPTASGFSAAVVPAPTSTAAVASTSTAAVASTSTAAVASTSTAAVASTSTAAVASTSTAAVASTSTAAVASTSTAAPAPRPSFFDTEFTNPMFRRR